MTHVLVTLLGAGPLQRVRWRHGNDEREHETCYAPVATAALVGGASEARVLLTDEARARHWEACRAELAGVGVASRPVDIPRGATEDEIWEIVGRVADAVVGAEAIIADVTHAFRHLPFVVFASLAYLAALGRVAVRGVYYGAYEARQGGVAPLLDLGPLLALGDWAYAARSLRETGNARWLEALLNRESAALVSRGGPVPAMSELKSRAGDLARFLPACLPLETGLAAWRALDSMAALRAEPRVRTVARPVLELLERTLADLAIAQRTATERSPGAAGGEGDLLRDRTPAVPTKAGIPLDTDELARELRLARRYLEWGRADTALLLLREWIVNRCLLAVDPAAAWLDYEQARLPMERAVAGLAARRRHAGEGGAAGLAALWSTVSSLRNAFAHCGFRLEDVPDVRARVLEALTRCEARLTSGADWWTAPPGRMGRVLVTPLGLSPGVLFTALRRLAPDLALVIASGESLPSVTEVCDRAGWDRTRVEELRVSDPHACFGDARRCVEGARATLLEAREVMVNLAGGTTAMQYLAERLAGEAQRLGIPTQRYACVDRRPRADQEREPYVLGECLLLDGDAPAPAGGGAVPSDGGA